MKKQMPLETRAQTILPGLLRDQKPKEKTTKNKILSPKQSSSPELQNAASALQAGAADLVAAAQSLRSGLNTIVPPQHSNGTRHSLSPVQPMANTPESKSTPERGASSANLNLETGDQMGNQAVVGGERRMVSFETETEKHREEPTSLTAEEQAFIVEMGASTSPLTDFAASNSKLLDEREWSPEPVDCAEHDCTEIAPSLERSVQDIARLNESATIAKWLVHDGQVKIEAHHTRVTEAQHRLDAANRAVRDNKIAEKEMKELHVGWHQDETERGPIVKSPEAKQQEQKVVNPGWRRRELMEAHIKRNLLESDPRKSIESKGLSLTPKAAN